MKNKEGRIIFEKDGLILINSKKEPVLQVRRELVVMGMIVGVN